MANKIEEVRGLFDQFGTNLKLLSESGFEQGELALLDFHATNYLCILICGAIERDVLRMIRNYIASNWSGEAAEYFDRRDNRIPINPTDMQGFLVRINEDWKDEMKNLLRQESEASAAISTLRARRNRIAHGGEIGVNMKVDWRMKNLKDHLFQIEGFLRSLGEIINKPRIDS